MDPRSFHEVFPPRPPQAAHSVPPYANREGFPYRVSAGGPPLGARARGRSSSHLGAVMVAEARTQMRELFFREPWRPPRSPNCPSLHSARALSARPGFQPKFAPVFAPSLPCFHSLGWPSNETGLRAPCAVLP